MFFFCFITSLECLGSWLSPDRWHVDNELLGNVKWSAYDLLKEVNCFLPPSLSPSFSLLLPPQYFLFDFFLLLVFCFSIHLSLFLFFLLSCSRWHQVSTTFFGRWEKKLSKRLGGSFQNQFPFRSNLDPIVTRAALIYGIFNMIELNGRFNERQRAWNGRYLLPSYHFISDLPPSWHFRAKWTHVYDGDFHSSSELELELLNVMFDYLIASVSLMMLEADGRCVLTRADAWRWGGEEGRPARHLWARKLSVENWIRWFGCFLSCVPVDLWILSWLEMEINLLVSMFCELMAGFKFKWYEWNEFHFHISLIDWRWKNSDQLYYYFPLFCWVCFVDLKTILSFKISARNWSLLGIFPLPLKRVRVKQKVKNINTKQKQK